MKRRASTEHYVRSTQQRRFFRSRAVAFCARFALSAICLAGCSGSKLTPVGGSVTLDGQALAEGTIHFAPADGQAPSQAAVIKEGAFKTELNRTNYKVQIYSPKPSKVVAELDENGPGGGPRVEELLPARYNIQSELTLNVSGPTNAANFVLRSK